MTDPDHVGDATTYTGVRIVDQDNGIDEAIRELLADAEAHARELGAAKTNRDNIIYQPVLGAVDHNVTERHTGGWVVSVVTVTEFRPVLL